jgi:hypothetical protein
MKKTKALLIGINDYSPKGNGGPDLRGCVNDVRDMANTLVICGFDARNIKVITDARATRDEILKWIDWLIADAKDGDSLVFHYSGHGSYTVDRDGDEVDGYDEVICPHDLNMIKDDELAARFGNLTKGANLEVFMDCCYSGTNTRALLTERELTESELTPRFLEPPFDHSIYREFKMKPALNVSRMLVPNESSSHVLWSACSDKQLANETRINGSQRGIFTYHLCSILRAANGNIDRSKLDTLLSAAIARYGFDQTPQLEATRQEILENTFN